jgi:hypothetical protein
MIEALIPIERIPDQQFLGAIFIVDTLRKQGIPVIGPVGVVSVETGRLTMAVENECLMYRWTGVALAPHMRKKQFTLEKTLAQAIAEENDL